MSRPIVQRPDVLFGAAHVDGTGIPVGLIQFEAATGRSAPWLCDEFSISRGELHAALTVPGAWGPSAHVSALLTDAERTDPERLLARLASTMGTVGGSVRLANTRLAIDQFLSYLECLGVEATLTDFRGLPVEGFKAAVLYAERLSRPPHLDRIEVNPKVMAGKPVIRGTRITIEHLLLELTHDADPVELIERGHPEITLADLRAALAWLAFGHEVRPWVVRNRSFADLPCVRGTEHVAWGALDALADAGSFDDLRAPDLPGEALVAAAAWEVHRRVPGPRRPTPRIVRDPAVMVGVPTIAGTSVTVGLVRGRLLADWSVEDLCLCYDLTADEVGCAVAFEPARPNGPC